MLRMAMARSAIEIRSPAVSSMSSSRGAGMGVTSCARSSSSSVVSPMAETATTTSLPALRVSTMRLATRLMLSALATDDPPYFCTIRATDTPGTCGWKAGAPSLSGVTFLARNMTDVDAGAFGAHRMGRQRCSGDQATAFESSAEGDLVGVLEVAADGQTRGQSRDTDFECGEQPAEIGRRRLAFQVGVGG